MFFGGVPGGIRILGFLRHPLFPCFSDEGPQTEEPMASQGEEPALAEVRVSQPKGCFA